MPPGELVGRRIAGKFVIDSFVGAGGMGAVYRARQVDLETRVAVKVLHASLASEPAFAARFKREARAASRIDHPNSMRVVDFGQEPDGLLYIAMEYLEGKNLHTILHEEGPLETARIEHLTRQALAALAAAHDLSIWHRDLKPENIIVLRKADDEGHVTELVKVCDFGIAKFAAAGSSVVPSQKLTAEGTLIGTPEYMSPEQARALEVDARSDLYSVGVILYELLTGKTPFAAETPLATVLMHLHDEPVPPGKVRAGVDPRLEAVCLKAMAKEPKDRFQTAREMRAALAPPKAVAAAAPAPPPAPRAPAKAALVLMPGESTSTPGMAAPAAEPRMRPAKGGAMATLMAESVRPLARTPAVAAGVAVAIACVGASLFFLRHRVGGGSSHAAAVTPVTLATAPPSAPSAAPAPASAPTEPVAAAAEPLHLDQRSLAHAEVTASRVRRPTPGGSGAVATPSGTPREVPAQPQPPPEQPSSGARVVVGTVSATRIASTDVANALPVARFTRCYRDGLAGQPPMHGAGKLHLDMSASEVVARFEGPSGFDSIGRCITQAAGDVVVRSLPPAGASADVELTFRPE